MIRGNGSCVESLEAAIWATAALGADTAWAFDDVLHAWWVEPGKILAGEYPGSPESEHHRSG